MTQLMNKPEKTRLITTLVVLVTLLITVWAIFFPPPPPPGATPDFLLYLTITTVISSVNVTLIIILLIAHIDIYRKTKSEFTIGLIVFTLTMLLHAIFSIPLMPMVLGFHAVGLGPFILFPNLFTSFALIVLLYLTFKY